MEQVSTWSQDCARGLAHPDSVAARRQRIAAAQAAETRRTKRLNHAHCLILENLETEVDVISLLHAVSCKLAKLHGPTSYLHPLVTQLDELADSIEFPEQVPA
jgi:hypothetical protein